MIDHALSRNTPRAAGVPTTSAALTVDPEPYWQAVIARDSACDGQFYYAVRTTGVYCRPSCGARQPKRANVSFHATAADAERAGFRPCRRCKPDQPPLAERQAALVEAACRQIEGAEESPSLAGLAARAGLSPSHFHCLFKGLTGLTSQDYAAALRAGRVRAELRRPAATVTESFYDAGFTSSGRFYARSNQILGMTPTAYRAGGASAAIRFAVGRCSLGAILVAVSQRGVCAILLGDDADALVHELRQRFSRAHLIAGDGPFIDQVDTVVRFVERPRLGLALPLDIRGTAFQHRVWQALQAIPPGATASYRDIAAHIGAPGAVRAVAGACAANPLAVAIPCHRVVRANGDLSGYRWGVERKRALLAKEALDQEELNEKG